MEEFETTRQMLPGFSTPGHPKEDDRIFADPCGKVEVTIAKGLHPGDPMPPYEFFLSTETGRRIKLHLQAGTGQVVKVPGPDGTEEHVLRLGPPCVTIYPGTYRLRGLVNCQEVFSKSLTVLNHPALP